jgi:hypothetical protein
MVAFVTALLPGPSRINWIRDALALALSQALRDGQISRSRASELARMVLHENARNLYWFLPR